VSPARHCLFLALALLAGCPRMQPVYVVNHRDEPLQLVYRNDNTYHAAAQRVMPCELREQKPRLFGGTDVANFSWPEAIEVPIEFDESRCEIRLTLPPKSSVAIGRNEFCSGATEYIGKPDFRPRLDYLRVEGQGGVIELSGWEVSRALIEKSGIFSQGYCRYDLR
jgi:hypothetical protein